MNDVSSRVRISNLPSYIDEEGLRQHVKKVCPDIHFTDIRITKHEGRSRRFGFIGCKSVEDSKAVIEKLDKTFIDSTRLSVEYAYAKNSNASLDKCWSSITKRKLASKKNNTQDSNAELNAEIEKENDAATIASTSKRILIRNLPYDTDECDLRTVCNEIGKVSNVTILRDRDNKSRGSAFVTFDNGSDAVLALSKLDGEIIAGRVVCVVGARKEPDTVDKINSITMSESKKKLLAKKLQKYQDNKSYNLLYVSEHAATSAISSFLNVEEEEITQLATRKSDYSLASKVAIAESIVLNMTKDWLKSLNLQENDFTVEGNSLLTAVLNKSKSHEQSCVIAVKHIGPWVDEQLLSDTFARYGKLAFVTFCPTKTLAIVCFKNRVSAVKAFEGLLMQKFMGYPLYLEFLPKTIEESDLYKIKASLPDEPDSIDNLKQTDTLYACNLAFSTTEEKLTEYFSKYEGFRRAVILKSRKTGTSLGHGFICFKSPSLAAQCLQDNLTCIIDGNGVSLEFSKNSALNDDNDTDRFDVHRKIIDESKAITSSTLIVKNLAFEATVKDLKELFGTYSNVKAIRIPKKPNGRIRGYAFVDFTSVKDAQTAYYKLTGVHLLGRKLVIMTATSQSGLGSDNPNSKVPESNNDRDNDKSQKTKDQTANSPDTAVINDASNDDDVEFRKKKSKKH